MRAEQCVERVSHEQFAASLRERAKHLQVPEGRGEVQPRAIVRLDPILIGGAFAEP